MYKFKYSALSGRKKNLTEYSVLKIYLEIFHILEVECLIPEVTPTVHVTTGSQKSFENINLIFFWKPI